MISLRRRSVNIPWPSGGFGDSDYIYAFQKIVMPIAYEFNPDLVISKLHLTNHRYGADYVQYQLVSTLRRETRWVNAMLHLPPMLI